MSSYPLPPALIEALRTARRITALTGAGISAESGVPTFRDAQTGLWARFRPEDLASPQAFEENPERVWEWYSWRRELVNRASPNPGHFALAEMRLTPGDKVVIYSDGVTEAQNTAAEFFGKKRLRDAVTGRAAESCAAIHDSIQEAVAAFTEGAPQSDDITVLVLEFHGGFA